MNTRTKWTGLAIVLLLAFGALAACVAYPPTPAPTDAGRGLQPVDFQRLRVLNDLTVNGDATVGGDATLTGDLSLNGGNYPIENASANRIVEFGATGAISETVVTPVAITTVTAYGCTVNSPSAAAQLCYSVESGGVLTFTIMNAGATPAAIVTPHAAGASFWIGGN